LNTELAGLVFRRVSSDGETPLHGGANIPSSSSSQWRWNGEKGGLWWEKMSSQGSPVIFLNGTCTDEAQMEVSRRFQVIETVEMRWGERDAPNGGRKLEFGGSWWWSFGEA